MIKILNRYNRELYLITSMVIEYGKTRVCKTKVYVYFN